MGPLSIESLLGHLDVPAAVALLLLLDAGFIAPALLALCWWGWHGFEGGLDAKVENNLKELLLRFSWTEGESIPLGMAVACNGCGCLQSRKIKHAPDWPGTTVIPGTLL